MDNNLDIKMILKNNGKMPEYGTDGSAGADIFINEDVMLEPQEIKKVSTGIFLEIPYGFEGQLRIRSSIGNQGVMLSNSVGTIDSDYRGEIKLSLLNMSNEKKSFSKYNKIAQIIFAPVKKGIFNIVENLDTTFRNNGGFGSTGIN